LVLIIFGQKGNQLVEIDLTSGNIKTMFQAPENSWLAAAVVSPDGRQVLLSYAPPPPVGNPQFGYSDLYLLPLSGSGSPQPLLTRKDPQESYFNPTWAPDGNSIAYTHLYRIDPNSKVPAFQNDVEQATLDGKTKPLIPHSLWPALSPDGTKLAYLNEDPITFGNDLYLANSDGSNPVPVLPPGINPPVDDHFFTKDGNSLVFSMVNPQTMPTSSWLENFLGVEVASAHTVPSDWYEVSIGGGEPRRLTNLNDVGMYADLSPDGQQVAFISATGLFIMSLDGTNLYNLSNQVYIGTVDWIP
jgi:Tol biopolymer transport system component